MTLRTYKVTGCFLNRTYYSQEFEIDDSEFEEDDEIEDYLQEMIKSDQSDIYHEWAEEGSEPADCGFNILNIERLA